MLMIIKEYCEECLSWIIVSISSTVRYKYGMVFLSKAKRMELQCDGKILVELHFAEITGHGLGWAGYDVRLPQMYCSNQHLYCLCV